MPELYLQKRLAADIKNVGINNVRILPDYIDEVRDALTRQDVERLIKDGKIVIEKKRRGSRGRINERKKKRRIKGEGRKYGSRKGRKGARSDKHEKWVNTIRKIRKYLKMLRKNGTIDSHMYRQLYKKAKGGTFNSLSDVKNALQQLGVKV